MLESPWNYMDTAELKDTVRTLEGALTSEDFSKVRSDPPSSIYSETGILDTRPVTLQLQTMFRHFRTATIVEDFQKQSAYYVVPYSVFTEIEKGYARIHDFFMKCTDKRLIDSKWLQQEIAHLGIVFDEIDLESIENPYFRLVLAEHQKCFNVQYMQYTHSSPNFKQAGYTTEQRVEQLIQAGQHLSSQIEEVQQKCILLSQAIPAEKTSEEYNRFLSGLTLLQRVHAITLRPVLSFLRDAACALTTVTQ